MGLPRSPCFQAMVMVLGFHTSGKLDIRAIATFVIEKSSHQHLFTVWMVDVK